MKKKEFVNEDCEFCQDDGYCDNDGSPFAYCYNNLQHGGACPLGLRDSYKQVVRGVVAFDGDNAILLSTPLKKTIGAVNECLLPFEGKIVNITIECEDPETRRPV